METGWFNISWFWYALVCLFIAIMYLIFPIPPYKEFDWARISELKHFVLRYFHSVVWMLLMIACIYMQFTGSGGVKGGKMIAFSGLVFYLIYLAVFALEKLK